MARECVRFRVLEHVRAERRAQIKTGKTADQYNPADHATVVAKAHQADEKLVKEAIEGALKAKEAWADMPWNDRCAPFFATVRYSPDVAQSRHLPQGC